MGEKKLEIKIFSLDPYGDFPDPFNTSCESASLVIRDGKMFHGAMWTVGIYLVVDGLKSLLVNEDVHDVHGEHLGHGLLAQHGTHKLTTERENKL